MSFINTIRATLDFIDAAKYKADIYDNLAALSTWTTYVPTWTGGSPTIGNGTLTARYMTYGKVVVFQLHLIGGTTTTWGAGTWTFTLPVTVGSLAQIMPGYAYDASATTTRVTMAAAAGGATTFTVLYNAGLAPVSDTLPFVWATGDELRITGIYMSA